MGLMKILAVSLLFLQVFQCLAAGRDTLKEKSVFESLTGIKKKMDAFNLYLNTQATFNVHLLDGKTDEAAFRMNHLRIEATGHINDWIYYRWRQALNSGNTPGTLDNLPNSIDYAAVGFKLRPDFSVFAGKQHAAFGGFEFDANPIEVYMYSELLNYMACFLTGVDFMYHPVKSQELHFQVVDSRNGSMEEVFGKLPAGVEKSRVPLGYSLNWNGSFWEGLLKTRWSASLFNDAKDKYTYYYAVGTALNTGRFNIYLDFMCSREDLDRVGIVSAMFRESGHEERVLNTRYISWVTRLDYRFRPKWNLFLKGMYETASVFRSGPGTPEGKYQTTLGYVGGLAFYPMKENLHFFLACSGNSFDYTRLARSIGRENYNTQHLSLGFIYKIPLF